MGTYLVSPVQTACQRVYITLTGKQKTSVYIIFDKKPHLDLLWRTISQIRAVFILTYRAIGLFCLIETVVPDRQNAPRDAHLREMKIAAETNASGVGCL